MTGETHWPLLVKSALDPRVGWSVSAFGAIAEFTRAEDEASTRACTPDLIEVNTARGGLRLHRLADAMLFASERALERGWIQQVALCLPHAACAMTQRRAIAELGPDQAALDPAERGDILFDLGLGATQVDACVRTSSPALLRALRRNLNKPLFSGANGIVEAIRAESPPRVFVSRIGRIEVRQPIPSPRGTTPLGPHTHVLPQLLRAARTHPATEPTPPGWTPCLHLYPPHATCDVEGRPYPFENNLLDDWFDWLAQFGDPDLYALKMMVWAAVRRGETSPSGLLGKSRFARATIRATLRQLAFTRPAATAYADWSTRYLPGAKGA